MLFDETNSLVEIDAQDDDFELGLAKKNLLLTHEEGKYPDDGSGPGAISLEDGQGLNQTGGSIAEPNLEQNQPNTPEIGSRTGSGTDLEIGSKTGSETVSKPVLPSIQARVESVSMDPLTPRPCCLLYTSPSPRDGLLSRMPSSA